MADTFPTKQDYTNETLKNDGRNLFKETDPQRESTFVGKAAKKPKRGNIIKKGPR